MSNLQTQEIEKIKEQFSYVIQYTQNIHATNIKTKELFKQWETNKERFIKIFGGLTYEFPNEVEFKASYTHKEDLFNSFYEYCAYNFKDKRILNFIVSQKEGIFENRVIEDNPYAVKGSRISKSLKFFTEDKETLIAAQNFLSVIIQCASAKGKLVISVHPLDYLSMSENNHNWTSCHSLDGEKSSGNLNYIADKHTVVCYLKSDKDQLINNFPLEVPWNSKKWRALLYISEDNSLIFKGKEYPYEVVGAAEFIREEFLIKLFNSNLSEWIKPEADCIYRHNYSFGDCKKIPINELIKDNPNTHHFNDCLRSHSYSPILLYDKTKSNFSTMHIGEEVRCLECEKHLIYFEDQVKCKKCGEGDYCEYCGNYDIEIETIDEEALCVDCYEENAFECYECEDFHLKSNLKRINGKYLCSLCMSDS